MQPEALADHAPQPIALDRAAHGTHGNRHTEPRPLKLIRLRRNREEFIPHAPTLGIHAFKFSRCAQAPRAREAERTADGHRSLRTQALAAFSSATSEHCASALRGHAGPKSMRACAAHLAWLVGTFHDFKALKTERKMGLHGTQRVSPCQYKTLPGHHRVGIDSRPLCTLAPLSRSACLGSIAMVALRERSGKRTARTAVQH